ncbi:MAG: ATP-binding protein [Bacteroidota bacterium]
MKVFSSMIGRLGFILSLTIIPFASNAQFKVSTWEEKRDSVLALLDQQQDTSLVLSYIHLGGNLSVPLPEADSFAGLAIAIAQKEDYSYGNIKANRLLGHIKFAKQEYQEAIFYYKQALTYALDWGWSRQISLCYEALPNTYFNLLQADSALFYNGLFKEFLIRTGDSMSLGFAYTNDGRYHHQLFQENASVKAFFKSVEVYENIGELTYLSDSYGYLADALKRNGDLEESKRYFQKSFTLNEEIDYPSGKITALINYALLLKENQKLKNGLDTLQLAIQTLNENLESGKMRTLRQHYYEVPTKLNMGSLLIEMGRLQEAEDTLQSLQINWREQLLDAQLAEINFQRAKIRSKQGLIKEAIDYANKASIAFIQAGNTENRMSVTELLAELNEREGDLTRALRLRKGLQSLRDSINDVKVKGINKGLLLEYETEERKRKIAELEQKSLEESNQRNIFLAGLIIVSLLAMGIWGFFRIRAQRDKQLLQKERELDKVKSRFFTQLSHELRTPITLILGPLEQVISSEKEPEKKNKLNLMKRNGQRLLQLVNQVMDLSKLQAGKLDFMVSLIELNPLVRYIFYSFQSRAESKRIDYQLFLPETNPSIYLDEEKFRQILDNLLSNGCKFVPEGGKLWVKVEEQEREVIIKVEDTGPGLTDFEAEHVFDPYYQTPGSQLPDEAGTGIGLALSKELAELHQGSLTVTSQKGVGSTFLLALPKGKEHLSDEQLRMVAGSKIIQQSQFQVEPITSDRPAIDPVQSSSDLPLVLVAEDVPDMQLYLRSVLQGEYELMIASDGVEALEMAKAKTPDIVIADIMMPRMDGMEFVENLKSSHQTDHIPVIFLSAKSTKEDRLEGWKRETFAFLEKPFNPQELLLVVQSALKMQRNMQVRFQGESILKPTAVAVNSRESQFLEKLTNFLENQLDKPDLSIEILADEMSLSRSQLSRKLKALTGTTPTMFVRNFRMQRAKQLLENDFGNVSEVADAVGISSPAYFSRVFTETFGKPPSDYLKNK